MNAVAVAVVGLCIAMLVLDIVLLIFMVFVAGVPFRVIWDEFKHVSRQFWLGGWGKT